MMRQGKHERQGVKGNSVARARLHVCVENCLSSRYFSRSFFACFLNLVTHTLVPYFTFPLLSLISHLAFMLSTCHSINDFH